MAGFTVPYAPSQIYTPNGRLVDLIRLQGEDAARAAELRGQQQAQLWSGVGNAIQSGVGSVLQAQAQAPKIALEKAQAAEAQSKVADTAAIDQASAPRPQSLAPGDQGPTQSVAPTRDQIIAALPGHLQPVVKRQFEDDDIRSGQVQKAQEDLAAANASKLSGLALTVKEHGYDPAALKLALDSATSTYKNDPAMSAQIQRVTAQVGNNPSQDVIQRTVDSIPLTASDQRRWEESVTKTRKGVSDAGLAALDHLAGSDGTSQGARDVLTNRIAQSISDGSILPGAGQAALMTAASAGPQQLPQIIDQFVSPEDKATWQKNRATTAKDLADAAKASSEAAGGKAPTEASLDAAQQDRLSKLAQGVPLTPQEKADTLAYQERKRTVSDPASIAAIDRQNRTINAQIASQDRMQNFQVTQAARKEITEKVELPYQTALSSVQTLRDTIDAAKGGNKVAGSLQSLETTMAAIRAQGLNRINTAEIGVTANAGNLFDRVSGWLGKADAGQPVPANIQKDMQEFAGILEKAAYKKYSDSFDSIAKSYELSDRQKAMKAPPPNAAAPSTVAPIKVGPFSVVVR